MDDHTITLMTEAGVYAAFKAYSDVTGTPMKELVNEALQDFSDVSIAARFEALQRRSPRETNVVCISSAR
jgi:hypothetical protein